MAGGYNHPQTYQQMMGGQSAPQTYATMGNDFAHPSGYAKQSGGEVDGDALARAHAMLHHAKLACGGGVKGYADGGPPNPYWQAEPIWEQAKSTWEGRASGGSVKETNVKNEANDCWRYGTGLKKRIQASTATGYFHICAGSRRKLPDYSNRC